MKEVLLSLHWARRNIERINAVCDINACPRKSVAYDTRGTHHCDTDNIFTNELVIAAHGATRIL